MRGEASTVLVLGTEEEAVVELVDVIQRVSLAQTAEDLHAVVCRAARDLLGADGASVIRRRGDRCAYVDEDAIGPLWKGREFPSDACVSGWVMRSGEAAVIVDVEADDRVPADVYRPTFVSSLVVVPIRPGDPLGAIGAYWASTHHPDDHQVALLRALANATAAAMQHLATLDAVEGSARDRLRLEVANARLLDLSRIDELTGLWNRRGFLHLASQQLARLERGGGQGALVYLDLDGMKAVNDAGGHEAGDALLVAVADALRDTCRAGDVVGRIGGDEFVVMADDAGEGARRLVDRLRARLRETTPPGERPPELSAGVAPARDGVELAELLRTADEAMYVDKRSRRGARSGADAQTGTDRAPSP